MNKIDRTISNFLNTEVHEYSVSVVKERALPQILDGLKPSQRKVLFTANKVANKKSIKTYALAGSVATIGGYSKGDGSLPGIIAGLTQNFVGSNNIPWLIGEGSWGTRFINDPASPRYTSSKIHNNFNKYFRDFELLEYTKEDGEYFEPNHFLPVIPTILLNGIRGIAVGYACMFQPYKESDIIENIRLYLTGKKLKEMKPYFKGFKGSIHKKENTFYQKGVFNLQRRQLIISEIPTSYNREQYNNLLIKLIEKNIVLDYDDLSDKNGFNFKIKLALDLTEEKVIQLFGLTSNLNEMMYAITPENELKFFEHTNDVIKYFVDKRKIVYQQRKDYHTNLSEKKIKYLKKKINFIQLLIDSKITKKIFQSRSNLRDWLINNEYPPDFVDIKIYDINNDKIKELLTLINDFNSLIKYFKNTKIDDLYEKDLQLYGE